MFKKLVVGNEKAIIGGVIAALLTVLAQLGVNGNMTIKSALYALGNYVLTHTAVWVTTNTPDVPPTPPQPEPPMNGVTQLTEGN